MLRLLLQDQTHDFVDAAQQPHHEGLVPRIHVHVEGLVRAVRSREEVELSVDVYQQEQVEGIKGSVAVCVRWQDWVVLLLEFELLTVLLPASGTVLADVDHDPEEELSAVVDDLQAEEDHHVPELNRRDVPGENGAVLQSSDEERQLQEDNGSVVDDPVAVAEHAPQQEHEDGEDVEVGDLGLKRAVNGRQDDQSVDDREDQSHHEELLGLEALVEGQHCVVADHDRRIREEAQTHEVVREDDRNGDEQQRVGGFPGVDGGGEGDGEDDLEVGEIGEFDEVEDGEGDNVGDDELDDEGLEAEFVRHFASHLLHHLFLRLYLHLGVLDVGLRSSHRFLLGLRLVLLGKGLRRRLLWVEGSDRLSPEVGLHYFLHDPAILARRLLIQKLHLDVPET